MDPISVSFVVFFTLCLGGFVVILCLGCLLHFCFAVNSPRYCNNITDEAIICDRLTKKERVAVFDKFFSNYNSIDIEVQSSQNDDDNSRNSNDDTKSYQSEREKLCVICLEQVMNKFTKMASPNTSIVAIIPSKGEEVLEGNDNTSHCVDTDAGGTSSSPLSTDNYSSKQFIMKGFQCKHVFHQACIQPWFEQGKISCPCCRLDLINPDDFKDALLRVLRKERIQTMHRWGVTEGWGLDNSEFDV